MVVNTIIKLGGLTMLAYYHVALKGNLEGTHFIPRIPESTMTNEDRTIPRVCVSPTLEGAVTGFAHSYKFQMSTALMSTFLYVYEIDACKIGCNNIKFWNQITNYVPDAYKTKEAWIMKEFTCKPKIYRFTTLDKYEREPQIGKIYTDTVLDKNILNNILNSFDIVCYKETKENTWEIIYEVKDESYVELWALISKSHEALYTAPDAYKTA
jgi:hypothetical protein